MLDNLEIFQDTVVDYIDCYGEKGLGYIEECSHDWGVFICQDNLRDHFICQLVGPNSAPYLYEDEIDYKFYFEALENVEAMLKDKFYDARIINEIARKYRINTD